MELSFAEIRRIADEARKLGTQEWDLSGGEVMLRPDFPEIFDYLTRHFRTYTLRTNGTLITPGIARLMQRPGAKWISLYGADAEVYDRVTRNPGGFEQLMRSFALLRENGVRFTVQLFPMRDNWHQWPQMMELARSLSSEVRIGAAWLHLSAAGDPRRNVEIAGQRLDPADVVALDPPSMSEDEDEKRLSICKSPSAEGRLFASCINNAKQLHIDAYGRMSFCEIIKDPALRYDLRQGSFQEGWETFIPSLAEKICGSERYNDNCGQCEKRSDCRWCPSYAWLEHRDYSAKLEFLCKVADEKRRYKENRRIHHRRFFRTAGITFQVDSDLAFSDTTFASAVTTFAVDGPGEENVQIHHHFSFEGLDLTDLGNQIYHEIPWTIYRKGKSWIYRSGSSDMIYNLGVFNDALNRGHVYHFKQEFWNKGNLNTISLPVTDQILLARLLVERQACLLHSAGVILEGKGLLFVGHSDAGKTTTTRLLEGHAEILCDDRNIVRLLADGFHVFGTWSHGESPLVSPSSAPLAALFFLRQSTDNRLTRLTDRREILHRLLPRVVRAYVDGVWWGKILDIAETLALKVPCYEMEFDKSGAIVPLLKKLFLV